MTRQKILFYPTIPGIDKTMPILSADKIVHNWKQEAAREFKNQKNDLGHTIHSISNCPGINTLQSQGYVVRAWQDIYIKAGSLHDKIQWRTPIDQQKINGSPSIEEHQDSLFKTFQHWPHHSSRSVIKFITGWCCKIPNDYVLIQTPVFYADDNRFTALSGIYSSDYGINNINVPVFWHNLNEETVIKAGTPLAQLIAVPKESLELEIKTGINKEALTINYILMNNTFVRNYAKIKSFFQGNH